MQSIKAGEKREEEEDQIAAFIPLLFTGKDLLRERLPSPSQGDTPTSLSPSLFLFLFLPHFCSSPDPGKKEKSWIGRDCCSRHELYLRPRSLLVFFFFFRPPIPVSRVIVIATVQGRSEEIDIRFFSQGTNLPSLFSGPDRCSRFLAKSCKKSSILSSSRQTVL